MICCNSNKFVGLLHQSRNRFLWTFTNEPQLDIAYLCDPSNLQEISNNITCRKGIGNIERVHDLKKQLNGDKKLLKQFLNECLKIPNKTHPLVATYGETPKIIQEVNLSNLKKEKIQFQEIVKRLKLMRTEQLGNVCGSKSYYFMGELAELERALVNYVTAFLLKNKFELISVPDILHRNIIEGCGMSTTGTRTQVYTIDDQLHSPNLCLSGTSEMALAGFLHGKTFSRDLLPLRLAAISRCYRAETSNLMEERGIYRVHEFTKVEMFVVSEPEDSDKVLEDILQIQVELFGALGLSFKVLDMPPHELGAQAYRKYDIEAWMAGRGLFGEISSCSNCLDFQARRLGICLKDGGFVHTLNGTACAVPRLLIALLEGAQGEKEIVVPEVLVPFFGGKKTIGKQKGIPELKLVKNKK